MRRKRVFEIAAVTGIFSALVLIFFKDVIFSNNIFVLRDLCRYFYPLRGYAFGLVKQGIIPFWNPYIYCGNPLLATHQVAIFYPVSLVYLIGSFDKAFNNFIYLHFILAGVSMYVFLLDQKISRRAAFVGSVSFAFSGYMMAVVNLLASMGSVVWVPITLWSFFRATSRSNYRYAVLTSIFLLVMFLAGEPAILYATGFILIFCGLRHMRMLAVIFTAFLLLSAFQMLPFVELLTRSGRGNMSYDIATKWSVPLHDLLNLIFPCVTEIEGHFKGYWEKQSWLLDYYMGLLPILMLPISAVFVKGRGKRIAFTILAVSVILVLGRNTPAYRIFFDHFPTFNLSRYPVKYFFLTTFSLAWLSALGFDAYDKRARAGDVRFTRFVGRYLYVALFAGIFALFLDTFFRDIGQSVYKTFLEGLDNSLKDKSTSLPFLTLSFFTIRRTIVIFLVFTLLLFFGTKRRKKGIWISLTVIMLMIGDLYSSNYEINLHYDAAKFNTPTGNVQFLMKDKSLFRFMASPATLNNTYKPKKDSYENLLESGKEMLYADRMIQFGIYDAFGYESIDRKRMSDIFYLLTIGTKMPDETRILDMLNVKYVVSTMTFKANGFELVKKSDYANIYENKNVLPRAFLSDKAVVIKNPMAICEKFRDRSWDPRKEVILEEAPNLPGSVNQAGGGNPKTEHVEITKYTPNEAVIIAVTASPKFLVLSDSYYPGWKVEVDGKADKLYTANYVFRAVYLDPGEHTVRFVFDPISFRLGMWISISTALIIAAWFAYRRLLCYTS